MSAVTVRPLRADDSAIVAQIFFDAVHHGTARDYTPEQRLAWAGAAPSPDAWRERLSGTDGFMAEKNGEPAGFMTLDGDGHIDLAFVRPAAMGIGVGWRLYRAIEQRAGQFGITHLTTEASLTAKPFFERQGWRVEREQTVVRSGVPLTNFRMSKQLNERP